MTQLKNTQSPVALITGGGSGIGRATAVRLANDGYRVAVAGRRESALRETAELIGGAETLVVVCDVTNRAAVTAMATRVLREFDRIDVVVNNAGISRTAAFDDVDLDGWREVMAADVESVVLVTQAALPRTKSPASLRFSRVTTLASSMASCYQSMEESEPAAGNRHTGEASYLASAFQGGPLRHNGRRFRLPGARPVRGQRTEGDTPVVNLST